MKIIIFLILILLNLNASEQYGCFNSKTNELYFLLNLENEEIAEIYIQDINKTHSLEFQYKRKNNDITTGSHTSFFKDKSFGLNIMHNSINEFNGFVAVLINTNENASAVYICQKRNNS